MTSRVEESNPGVARSRLILPPGAPHRLSDHQVLPDLTLSYTSLYVGWVRKPLSSHDHLFEPRT